MSRGRRARWIGGAGLVAVAGALIVRPASVPTVEPSTAATPFRWDAADLFAELEQGFTEARQQTPEVAAASLDEVIDEAEGPIAQIAQSDETPREELARLAELQFRAAVLGAARPGLLPLVEDLVVRTRVAVMTSAARWPADRRTHEALYEVVFGGRIALEEALVQAGPSALEPLVEIEEIPSEAPFVEVGGVRVHSGDVLLSRGGAPTSALIARGSDFANTFSHAALAHVDPDTGVGTVVESLIETGTVLSTVEDYLESKKHRIVVLRLRPDHPALAIDPQVTHRAASRMLGRLRTEPAAYDFGMFWDEPSRMFCSEVVYHAYRPEGVSLWPIRSDMTTPGLVRWLGHMGVREFSTLVPSDLEFDAQLRAVVEWRDLAALMDYRRDNAITDVLLEAADAGADLGYPGFALPLARLAKAFSVVQSWVGAESIVPRGMSADAALRVQALVSTVNPAIKAELVDRERAFARERGYPAPYWELVSLARLSLEAVRDELGAVLR